MLAAHDLARRATNPARCAEAAEWLGFNVPPTRWRPARGFVFIGETEIQKVAALYANFQRAMVSDRGTWETGDDWAQQNRSLAGEATANLQIGSYDFIVRALVDEFCAAAKAVEDGGHPTSGVRGKVMNIK